MIIDDSTLIRFINNDLSRSEKNKIQLLINNNPKIKYRVQGLINFRSMLKDESKANKKIKMPETLYEKISSEKNIKNYVSKEFNNFYKIAAGILAFVSIGLVINLPNKAYLSQNPPSKINSSKFIELIFYDQSSLDKFLSNNDNCSEIIDKKNNKEVFLVSCKKD